MNALRVITPALPCLDSISSIEAYAARLREPKALGVEIDAGVILAALQNPLAALAALAGLSLEDAAEVGGVTVGVMQSERLDGRRDAMERAVGRLALSVLVRLRGELRTVAMGVRVPCFDEPADAADAFALALANNRALARVTGAGTRESSGASKISQEGVGQACCTAAI